MTYSLRKYDIYIQIRHPKSDFWTLAKWTLSLNSCLHKIPSCSGKDGFSKLIILEIVFHADVWKWYSSILFSSSTFILLFWKPYFMDSWTSPRSLIHLTTIWYGTLSPMRFQPDNILWKPNIPYVSSLRLPKGHAFYQHLMLPLRNKWVC